jgi:hypothetical protein
VRIAENVSAGFVWPPRPGSCSTARWAPPTSDKEIAEHKAATDAEWAAVDAKAQAEREAKQAEARRSATPALMNDDELQRKLDPYRMLKSTALPHLDCRAAEFRQRAHLFVAIGQKGHFLVGLQPLTLQHVEQAALRLAVVTCVKPMYRGALSSGIERPTISSKLVLRSSQFRT